MPLEREGADPVNGGLVTGKPPHELGAAESPELYNSDPSDPYGVSERWGSVAYVAATASTQNSSMVNGNIAIHPTTGNVFVTGASIIMFSAKDSAAFASIPSSGVSSGVTMGVATLNLPAASVASGPQSLIVTDQTIPLLFNPLTNSVFAASMASTGINAAFALVYEGRAFVFGRADGYFLNWVSHSALNDITDWTTANNAGGFQVGDSAAFMGGQATRGGLYFLKRNSIWVLTGTSPFDYEVQLVTDNMGCISKKGSCTDGQGVYFASDDGIYYVNGLNVTRVSDKVRASYLAIPDKTKISLAYRGEKLYCFHNSSGTSANDVALVAAPRRKLESGDVQAIWTKWTGMPYGAVTNGGPANYNTLLGVTVGSSFQVYALDRASIADASVTVTYNTPHWDFRDPESKKQGVWWNMHVRPTANATQAWTAQLKADGASVGSSYSVSIPSGASHAYAGRAAKTGWEGRYLSLELSAVGQVTLYGVGAYAEVQSDGDYPRLES